MDSITQAVLGASIQGALLGRWQGRKALLYGAALATLPDLDVVIDYGDAVGNMTYHRGFSHSLFVLSGLALLLTWLIRRYRPHPGYSDRRLLLTLWLVLITHPLLDAFTSYGTQLFWPLMPTPTAWSSLFIIDPLYTLPLIAAVVISLFTGLRENSWRIPSVALAVSTLYIGFSMAGKFMAEQRVEAELARQGIQAEQLFVTPTPLNTLLWRVIVLDGEHYHEALVGWLDAAPPQLQRLPRGIELREQLLDSPKHQRLAWFSNGVLRYDQIGDRLIVTDLRLGMTGFHPFRFDFARLQDGQWQVHEHVDRLPFERGEPAHLALLLKRIWQPDLDIPLLAWAAELEKPLLTETRSH
ncbi:MULTISPECIES: metal-dependent hydrolase [Pseudomonadaceae]|jgi:inner membrane protein|uniref:Metal-dependent hydrolase n=1 Tax=Ectopseudomonas hydrolytica TaxID=2493633 RepID=A0ABY5ABH9_9GAMM|nr:MULTISPECIES: metal-dependent hydrolase [Pseudomonas]ATH83176.1 metal-dependent hydrolase [Pseudomonas mendocina]EJO95013.1 membrane-bound metal-dependent hydrolase [Pseudomonas mendocina DLHK]MBA4243336.1 metal-dependent hydrolase [Pseudomonas sp.]MBF8163585.1 metal-dependent hydrolase [Pseudomonas mendocina]MDH0096329.1 metal-dependent hydrolase [Pseudomonas sp. GD04158]